MANLKGSLRFMPFVTCSDILGCNETDNDIRDYAIRNRPQLVTDTNDVIPFPILITERGGPSPASAFPPRERVC